MLDLKEPIRMVERRRLTRQRHRLECHAGKRIRQDSERWANTS
jgi:hypothetical protein